MGGGAEGAAPGRGYRRVAADHGGGVGVDENQAGRVHRPPRQVDDLALVGDADLDHLVGVLGVMVVEPVGMEWVEDTVADGTP